MRLPLVGRSRGVAAFNAITAALRYLDFGARYRVIREKRANNGYRYSSMRHYNYLYKNIPQYP